MFRVNVHLQTRYDAESLLEGAHGPPGPWLLTQHDLFASVFCSAIPFWLPPLTGLKSPPFMTLRAPFPTPGLFLFLPFLITPVSERL